MLVVFETSCNNITVLCACIIEPFTTEVPTIVPTIIPTVIPSNDPTKYPTNWPSIEPTQMPTINPPKKPMGFRILLVLRSPVKT